MERDLNNTTQTDMTGTITNASVDAYRPDTAQNQKETEWQNDDWNSQVGYFKGTDVIPQFHRAVTALSTWTAGKGFTTDNSTEALLANMRGWGNETFDEIMMNMINMKKVTGDAYAEIIRNDAGTLINLKIIGGDVIKIIVNSKGMIEKYEQTERGGKKKTTRTFQPDEILHLTNDRVADEIHGTSLADIVSWIVIAKREAMEDWKRALHLSTIRVLYIDSQNPAKLLKVKEQYAKAKKDNEVLILPGRKDQDMTFETLNAPPIDPFMRWIEYLDSLFYQVVGVPRVIATSEGFTESGGKVGFLTFEPVYTKEQMLLEGDLWNQLAIKVKFSRPPSLGGDLARDEAKDPQAIQPNDTNIQTGQ